MTKGTYPESWTPRLGNRVYLGSICVVIVVSRGGRKRAFGAKNVKLSTHCAMRSAHIPVKLHQVWTFFCMQKWLIICLGSLILIRAGVAVQGPLVKHIFLLPIFPKGNLKSTILWLRDNLLHVIKPIHYSFHPTKRESQRVCYFWKYPCQPQTFLVKVWQRNAR